MIKRIGLTEIKEKIKMAMVPGCLMGILNGIGYGVKKYQGLSWNIDTMLFSVTGTVVSIFLIALFYLGWEKYKNRKHLVMSDLIPSKKLYFLLMIGLVLILWLPSYLSVYPGLVNYDAPGQLTDYLMYEIREQHPVIHTLLWGSFFTLGYSLFGSITMGVAVYFVFQLVLFSLLLGYLFLFLYEQKVPVMVHILTMFIVTMYPPVVLHLLCVTKDNYFALFFIDFLIINYKLFTDTERFFSSLYSIVLWIVFGLGTLMFRNNAIYAAMIFAPIWIVATWKRGKCLRKALGMLGVGLACFLVYKYPLTQMIVVKGISPKEMLSVPAQQIARVYVKYEEELSEQEKEMIEVMYGHFPIKEYYQPLIADITKGSLNLEVIKNNGKEYVGLYADLLQRYPKEYVDSFLENTYGYWYLWPELILTWEGRKSFMLVESYPPVVMDSKFPALLTYYQLFDNSNLVNGEYIWSFVFMPATYFYFCVVVLFYGINNRDKTIVGITLFLLTVWLTYLLGPVVLVRYVLFLYLFVPVGFTLMYGSRRNSHKIEEERKEISQ